MGVLNVTPDSFSDGGRFLEPGAALEHAQRMIEAGAAIIDIGGGCPGPGPGAREVDVGLGHADPPLPDPRRAAAAPRPADASPPGGIAEGATAAVRPGHLL